eukprot:TRINITY_DN27342_c0_g1_i1.p1 TRINITY_DN27342_c0_g1~~TRINITY_DN27342_c0_g1_i1.p1  ORF type:complete len:877 (+),score=130.04 TRINITY_DN27342_c0_g1_i1:49-2679(+)
MPAENVRFRGDPYRYHHECRSGYLKPVHSFCTELLQNSLDACSRLGPQHEARLSCDAIDSTVAGKGGQILRRVQVLWRDNGIGMDRETVQDGLLQVGANAATRKDRGRKIDLGECAGGFGMAKVLLFLAQDQFEIQTRHAECPGEGVFVSASFGREEQEDAQIDTLEAHWQDNPGRGPRLFGHGTLLKITLNPWVMAIERTAEPASEVSSRSSMHGANVYSHLFLQTLQKSRLPVTMVLNGQAVSTDFEPGEELLKLEDNAGRMFGTLFSKPALQWPAGASYNVVLQVLPGRENPQSPYFLHCFSERHTCLLQQKKEVTVLLHSHDQHGTAFTVGETLMFYRDRLSSNINYIVTNALQSYFADPLSLRPEPESLTPLVPSASSFSEWFDRACKKEHKPRPPEFWRNEAEGRIRGPTRAQANEHLGNTDWKHNLGYRLLSFKAKGIRQDQIPSEYQNIDNLSPESAMWLEIFGAYVRTALEAKWLLESSERSYILGRDDDCQTKFELAFFHGPKKDTDCPNLGPVTSPDGTLVFVMRPDFQGKPCTYETDKLNLKRAVAKCKQMAIHQVAHMHIKSHSSDFIEHYQELIMLHDEVESSERWSWFHLYKDRTRDRIMREVQMGRTPTKLLEHMAALDNASNPDVGKEVMQQELDNVRKMMKDAFAQKKVGLLVTGAEARMSVYDRLHKMLNDTVQEKVALAASRSECADLKKRLWSAGRNSYSRGNGASRRESSGRGKTAVCGKAAGRGKGFAEGYASQGKGGGKDRSRSPGRSPIHRVNPDAAASSALGMGVSQPSEFPSARADAAAAPDMPRPSKTPRLETAALAAAPWRETAASAQSPQSSVQAESGEAPNVSPPLPPPSVRPLRCLPKPLRPRT